MYTLLNEGAHLISSHLQNKKQLGIFPCILSAVHLSIWSVDIDYLVTSVDSLSLSREYM
jgi:hypothetical protein